MNPCNHPRTSVVIPARNAGKTLVETLNSLLAQSDPDWEALIIDDGSTDETADIIRLYTHRDGRFVGLQGEGAGASAARNLGLSRAGGRRVLFLDSDDWIDDYFLELMNGALDAEPDAVAAYCGDRRVMPDGRQTPIRSDPRIAEAPFEAFARSCAAAIHAILIEREILARIGGFDTSLRTCEDWDLWQRAARIGGRWVHVDAPLSYYRASEHSLTQDVDQMLADAAVVIGRGFSADDRLCEADPANPVGASTADGKTADLAYSYFALWCSAFDCGRRGIGTAAVEHLSFLLPSADFASSIIEVLLDGLMVGLRAVPSQLAARWPEFGASLTALVAELGRVWNDPVAARRIQYRFERLMLDYDDLAESRHLSLTLGLRVDLRNPAPVTPPPGVDRIYVYLCDGRDVRALLDLGTLGTITTRYWLELAASRLGYAEVAAIAGPSLGWSLTLHKLGHALREASDVPRTAIRRFDWRRIRTAAAQKALFSAAGPSRPAHSHQEYLYSLQMEADQSAKRLPSNLEKPVIAEPRSTKKGYYGDRHAFWEDLFQEPDPWNYGSLYEQEKYGRQLMLLPGRPIGKALELACAEGRFTEKLAPNVERLIATDISTTALQRARDRCCAQGNIEFRQLDLAVDPLPDELDLIVCSEVLYFLDDEAELERVAQRLTAALKPGGHILTAHAFVLKEDLSRTGFDWENPWGAMTITRVFSAVSGLALERSLCTELYRIDRFVRIEPGRQRGNPTIENLPISAEIEIEVARHIQWGGAVARRADLAATERHQQVPVLLYHRIADDGPLRLARYVVSSDMFRAQMTWLRRNGYHTIVSEELAWFLSNNHPFVGRPVMISFDDGFQDFAGQAWPILRINDFRAQVFVVTDLVGQTAEWDRHLGEPAPLMDASTIVGLAAEGVSFGSHLASHRGPDGLSTRELVEELMRSRAMLRQWLDRPADSFAAPFGLTDERLRLLAAECGFRTGFSTEPGVARLTSDPLNLPRIEVRGDLNLESFITQMEACR
jgi:glycosyltransferase involved in cell wall biosynthesis/peptidoglycan/xylan/chitin deacetylase (PgdA/CDA1 family)